MCQPPQGTPTEQARALLFSCSADVNRSRGAPMGGCVLFLGAGSSVSAPTCLPAFPSLARGVLGSVGWRYGSGVWRKAGFPAFGDPGRAVSPEVLFGTLQGFGVDYTRLIANELRTDRPNAAHR